MADSKSETIATFPFEHFACLTASKMAIISAEKIELYSGRMEALIILLFYVILKLVIQFDLDPSVYVNEYEFKLS